MSGGHFDYSCFTISAFAEDLQREIDANSGPDGFGYSQETMNRLGAAKDIIDVAAMLAREVEWLYSGDHGEESFQRLADEILATYEGIMSAQGEAEKQWANRTKK